MTLKEYRNCIISHANKFRLIKGSLVCSVLTDESLTTQISVAQFSTDSKGKADISS